MIFGMLMLCVFAVVYVWIGYPLIIVLLAKLKLPKSRSIVGHDSYPSATVVIPAKNEGKNIAARLNNLLALEYPSEVKILVGSDGSTDETVEVVKSFENVNVMVRSFSTSRGRAPVHNDLLSMCETDIVIFTDSVTEFDKDVLKKMGRHFQNPKIGCVVGSIIYKNKVNSVVGKSAGLYWRYEQVIRKAESALGLASVGTGACMAIRKKLFGPLLSTEDVDSAQPITIAMRGHNVIYDPTILAYDEIVETSFGLFKTNVRKTTLAFGSILRRVAADLKLRNLPIAASILSHRTGRHLTPFFLLGIPLFSACEFSSSLFAQIMIALSIAYMVLVGIGYFFEKTGRKGGIPGLALSFFILNVSRLVGVWKCLTGSVQAAYQTNVK
jgi:glycosyltransferase involved in cell wall biosynthesis